MSISEIILISVLGFLTTIVSHSLILDRKVKPFNQKQRIPVLILYKFLYRTEGIPKFLSDYCTPISDNTGYFDINQIVLEKISFKD